MEVFVGATPEEILEAEYVKCKSLSSEYCKRVRSEIEMEEQRVREEEARDDEEGFMEEQTF